MRPENAGSGEKMLADGARNWYVEHVQSHTTTTRKPCSLGLCLTGDKREMKAFLPTLTGVKLPARVALQRVRIACCVLGFVVATLGFAGKAQADTTNQITPNISAIFRDNGTIEVQQNFLSPLQDGFLAGRATVTPGQLGLTDLWNILSSSMQPGVNYNYSVGLNGMYGAILPGSFPQAEQDVSSISLWLNGQHFQTPMEFTRQVPFVYDNSGFDVRGGYLAFNSVTAPIAYNQPYANFQFEPGNMNSPFLFAAVSQGGSDVGQLFGMQQSVQYNTMFTLNAMPVPEPSTIVFVGMGAAFMVLRFMRRRNWLA